MTIKPITPNNIAAEKCKHLPDAVIEVWNKLIAEKYSNGSSLIYQEDALEALENIASEPGVDSPVTISRCHIFTSGWLDIEPIYEEAGWTVDYDKPAFNESYRATFLFTRKK